MNIRSPIEHGAIAIKGDTIIYVGKKSHTPKVKAEKIIDAHGKLAMPGLINCHTHLAMTLFRGIAEDKELRTWLNKTIWPLEAKLQAQDVYYGSLLGCLEMIKCGTTCFSDMYFFENMVAEAVRKTGLRAVLSSGIIEAGDSEKGEKMFKENVEFAEKFNEYADGRVHVQLGPHAVYTCSPELLARVRETASKLKVGIHIHLAESKEMQNTVKKLYGSSEVELLEKIGFLKPDVLAAHCIHVSKAEMKLMARRDVKVAYNPVANMKLAQGIAKINDFVGFGLTVGIGTDGPASNNSLDMFENMKIAALLQKIGYMDSTVLPAEKVVRMATVDGAKALRLENAVGSLEVGKKADVILLDLRKPHLVPLHDLYANIVYSACGSDVDTVIVDGKILMEGRKVKTVNEFEVLDKAQQTAFDLLAQQDSR